MENNYLKVSMNEQYAKEICAWKYDGDYAIYNLPSYEEALDKGYGMTKKENQDNYICYIYKEKVVAYVNMKEMPDNKIFMGIGLRPDYCGQGKGKYFLEDSIKEIQKRYPGYLIYLEVRSFNQRAIRAYQKVGFKITDTVIKKDRLGNDCEFIVMELK